MAALGLSWRHSREYTTKGDGHPVIILPGFLAHDVTTHITRKRLIEMGYSAYGWENGQNLGFSNDTRMHLRDYVSKIYQQHDNRPISLIGHSLGGVFAREIAREFPDKIRSVISLGSPFGTTDDNNTTPKALRALHHFLNADTAHITEEIMSGQGLTPPPVPTTSVLSKQDGVVHWSASLNPSSPQSENILIPSSHVGMIINPIALDIILNRLAQKEGEWKPYSSDHLPWYVRSILLPSRIKDSELPAHPNYKGHDKEPLFA